MNSQNKEYIGDSVYAAVIDGQLVLTTENGNGPGNTIYLEPEVWDALVRYVGTYKEAPPVSSTDGSGIRRAE